MSNKILVIGASGPIGSELVKQLSAAQVPVVAAVQTDEEAQAIRLPQVQVVQVSYDSPDPVLNVMGEVEKVFLALPLLESHVANTKKVIEAAKRAGVKHLVYLSSFVAETNNKTEAGRFHREAEKLVVNGGIPYTILRPRALMQSFTSYNRAVNGRIRLPYGKSRVSFVDARDVAAVAVEVLTADGHDEEVYSITGGEALTAKEIASHLARTTGKIFSYHETSAEQLRDSLKASNHPNWIIDVLMDQHVVCRDGLASSVSGVVQFLTGRKPIGFADFAKDFSTAI